MIGTFKPDKKRILLLLWHPETKALSSGGFVRIKEFLKAVPDDFIVDVLDNFPTIVGREKNIGDISQYKIPEFIIQIKSKISLLGSFLERMAVFGELIRKGSGLNRIKKYQVIYAPMGEPFTVLAAIVLSRLYKAKLVIDSLNVEMPTETWIDFYRKSYHSGYSMVYSIGAPLYMYLATPVLTWCFNRADYVVTVSPYLINRLRNLGVRTPIDFTPSGIDYASFAGEPAEKKVYDGVFIGRHEITKGIFDLISAWRIVVNSLPTATLLMVGSCDEVTRNILARKIKEHDLENQVILAGELSEEEKIKSLKQSKVYIHLALMEPLFPVISILEGLACGLPLVGYDVPAYQEIAEIHHHKAISLEPVGDYEGAAREIIRYLQLEPDEVIEIGHIAQEYAKRFNWGQIAQKQFNIIREVSGGTRL